MSLGWGSGTTLSAEFDQILNACLTNVAGDVEGLLDATLSFDFDKIVRGKARGLVDFRGQTLQLVTTERMDPSKSPVGLLVPEVAAIDMGSTLLMTQGEVDQFNAEIASAYDEVVNVMIGGWKLAAPSESDRLSSAQDLRTRDAYTADGLEEFLDDQGLEIVVLPLSFNGAMYPFGVVGSPEWLQVHEDLSGPAPNAGGESNVAPLEDSVGSGDTPSHMAPSTMEANAASVQDHMHEQGEQPDARMMLVDLSGALNEWLTEQLQQGQLRFVRPSDDLHELNEQASLVIVGPNPELFRKLQVPQCVVSKTADLDDSEPVNFS